MNISEPCRALLGISSDYHHLYQGRFANHLPMALVALDKMGAAPAQLNLFYDTYSSELEVYPLAGGQPAVTDLAMELGFSARFDALHQYFIRQINSLGHEAVLKRDLPLLWPGLAASGFHAVIRLAYALEAGNIDDIAVSLAYWASEYHDFTLDERQTDGSLEDIIVALAPGFEGATFGSGTINSGMTQAARILAQCDQPIYPRQLSLAEIAAFAIDRYAATGDFTLLHLVTGSHAIRQLLPYVDDQQWALKLLWQSVVIAFFSTGLEYSAYVLERTQPTPDWEKITSRVLDSHNDHQIKLVYSCWQEWLAYGNPVYIDVARHVAMA